jgi:hypothetical protein
MDRPAWIAQKEYTHNAVHATTLLTSVRLVLYFIVWIKKKKFVRLSVKINANPAQVQAVVSVIADIT